MENSTEKVEAFLKQFTWACCMELIDGSVKRAVCGTTCLMTLTAELC